VSIRSVAAAAGVNHGLVHRHFGSKEALVAAVLGDLAERLAARVAAAPDGTGWLVDPDDEVLDRFWRILARTILDGGDPAALQRHHPVVAGLVERMVRRGVAEDRARLAAARITALALGWLVFEPFLEAAAGLDSAGRAGRRRTLLAAAERLVDAPGA
jgi:AcrR family transcriptional regulator